MGMNRETHHRPGYGLARLLGPLVLLAGVIGGAAGGIIAPSSLDGWRFGIPGRHIVIFGVLGAAIGFMPGLVCGVVAHLVGKRQSGWGSAVLLSFFLAVPVFCVAVVLSGLALGLLFLQSLGDC